MDEIELKFAVTAQRRVALEGALRRGTVRVVRLQAIYFDTADELLGSHGVAVRLRNEGRHWVQTAKVATGDPLRRLEHDVPVTAPRGTARPVLDLARHDAGPVGKALRRALGDGAEGDANAALSERFRTDVSRIVRTLRIDGAHIELSLDTGRIVAGDRSVPVCEFELELKSGPVSALLAVARQWSERHGLWLSTASKAERGGCLARGEVEGEPIKATTPHVRSKRDARAFFIATLESCLAQVLGNSSELSAGAANEEFVHQLRIGLRRMRTALRELRFDLQGADPAWEPVLRSAFQELGRHRDEAIVVPAVRVALDAVGIPPFPNPDRERGVRPPNEVVRDASFQRMLLSVLAFTHEPAAADVGNARSGKVRSLVAARLGDLHRRLTRDAKRFSKLDPTQQHRVRKRLKRLRYLSEFAAPLFGDERVTRYLANWRKAQDALGEYNDQRIATDAFRTQALQEPRAWFAVGWLTAERRSSVKRCETALCRASKTAAFWTR